MYKHSSDTVDLHLRKFSSNNRLNQSQLIDYLNTLSLIAWDNCKPIMALYEQYQADPGQYLLKPLLITAIMLGNSLSHTKAKLIFEAFDISNSKKLTVNTFYELIDLILDISIEKLPKLSELCCLH